MLSRVVNPLAFTSLALSVDILRQLLFFPVTVSPGLSLLGFHVHPPCPRLRSGVSPLADFVLPLGATMNKNGTAPFEGFTCVFLVQVSGTHRSLGRQLVVVLVLTSVGVPAEGIAVIIGVDRLLDMARTVPKVVGDASCTVFVAKKEGFELKIRP